MAQATPSTGVCPGPRRGGGESSPFCGAKGGRGAQRRRGFIRPKHRRTCSQPPPSLSLQRRGPTINPPLCKGRLRGVLQRMPADAQAIQSPHANLPPHRELPQGTRRHHPIRRFRQRIKHPRSIPNCLSEYCSNHRENLKLIPELAAQGGIPDGTVKDSLRMARGYWEAKDTHDDLDTEIQPNSTAATHATTSSSKTPKPPFYSKTVKRPCGSTCANPPT